MIVKFFMQVLTGLIAVISNSHAGNWYDTERRSCEFESAISIGPPFKLSKTAAGGYYYSIPKADLNKVLNAPNGVVRTARKLSGSDLLTLKTKVKALASGPQAASAALAMASEIADFSGVYAIASGGLLNWLSAKAGTTQANVDRLVDFIAAGGEAGYDIAFRSAPVGFKPLALVMTTYQVRVGEEPTKRKWLFSTCLLPIEILLSEVVTTATGANANNKRLNRTDDGTWTQWDIAEGKFDSKRFKYVEQDVAYAYFVDATDSTRRTRIHLYGGPMESDNTASGWKPLYLSTDSR